MQLFLDSLYYELVRLTAYGSVCIFVLLLLIHTPKKTMYRQYNRARLLLAVAFLLTSANAFSWLYFFFSQEEYTASFVMSIDTATYLTIAWCLRYSLNILLNKNFVTWRQLAQDFVFWLLTVVSCLLILANPDSEYCPWLFHFSLAVLVAYVALCSVAFSKAYRQKMAMYGDYFSDDVGGFFNWINKSLIFTVVAGALAVLMILLGSMASILIQIVLIVYFFYMASSFLNYVQVFDKFYAADVAIEDIERRMESEAAHAERRTKSERYMDQLGPKVEEWIKGKHYLQEQFTIDDLAATLLTNKYYLSRFINLRFGKSFSLWIAELRISEAKRLMVAEPDVTLESVAIRSGFSSASYFSKVFSKSVGESPASWRKTHAGG